MGVLKKYNLVGDEIGQIAIEDDLLTTTANSQMIKDYIVAIRRNARQWSANTKTRAEVCHSGQKPHPQKGTGRARQGYLGAPQYKGGGRVHTPRPKFDQHVRINQKERRAAVRHLILEKMKENAVHVLQFEEMNEPKTKRIAQFLNKLNLNGKKVLFLGESLLSGVKEGGEVKTASQKYDAFLRSMSNIQGSEFCLMPNVNGYDVMVHHELVVLDSAVDQLKLILGSNR